MYLHCIYYMQPAFSNTPYNKSMAGLQVRPTYQHLVDYIERDPDKINYRDRKATILRNSLDTTRLDGLGSLGLDQRGQYVQLNRPREQLLQDFARNNHIPLAELKQDVERLGL